MNFMEETEIGNVCETDYCITRLILKDFHL